MVTFGVPKDLGDAVEPIPEGGFKVDYVEYVEIPIVNYTVQDDLFWKDVAKLLSYLFDHWTPVALALECAVLVEGADAGKVGLDVAGVANFEFVVFVRLHWGHSG